MKSQSKGHRVLRLRCPEVLLRTVISSHLEFRLKVNVRDVDVDLHSFLLAVLGLRLDEPLHFFNGLLEGGLDERAQVVHHHHFSVGRDGVLPDLFVELPFEALYFL